MALRSLYRRKPEGLGPQEGPASNELMETKGLVQIGVLTVDDGYLAGEGGRPRSGAPGVAGGVGEGLAGQEGGLLLLGHNLLDGCNWERHR